MNSGGGMSEKFFGSPVSWLYFDNYLHYSFEFCCFVATILPFLKVNYMSYSDDQMFEFKNLLKFNDKFKKNYLKQT